MDMNGTDAGTQAFIKAHENDDVRRLALKAAGTKSIDLPFALEQIAGRQTARRKLPTWADTEGIIYPPHLSMEQCSSEQTALYKADVAARLTECGYTTDWGRNGNVTPTRRFIDITGGFGVDFSFIARHFDEAVYVERQEHLCRIAEANMKHLGLTQAVIVNADGTEYATDTDGRTALIFADPARRDDRGGRTFAIADCTPDMTTHTGRLLDKADRVMIKLSPMLDWRKAVADIDMAARNHNNGHTTAEAGCKAENSCGGSVSEVHIVSAGGECKELLLVVARERPEEGLRIFCVNDDSVIDYYKEEDNNNDIAMIDSGVPECPFFLYEPNASLMKAGCFGLICRRYSLWQISHDSHLFVSDEAIKDFPGRSFRVEAATSMNKKELRKALNGITKANITTRNFPLSVAELRKRLKLNEGGDTYIFATTLQDGAHVLLICCKTL